MLEPHYHLEGIVKTRSEEMEDFEGPLDVIVLLLSKNKIEIQDVSITAILEQYLAYLDEMKRLDIEIASEFITMASHLIRRRLKVNWICCVSLCWNGSGRKRWSKSAVRFPYWNQEMRSVAACLSKNRSLCAATVLTGTAMSRQIC